jgi:ribosomal protein L15
MGGGRGRAGDRRSGMSVPLTLIGKRPLITRLIGRGVSVPSLDSSPPDSVSERSVIAFCFKNFFICEVTANSSGSIS